VAVGAAMDYSRASSSDSKFQQAADTAALATAIAVQKDMIANERKRDSEYEEAAHEVFLANLDVESRAQVTGKDLRFGNGRKQAEYIYTAAVPMAFGGLVGSSTMTIGGEAVAALPGSGGKLTADIHLLMDTSASMGLAADPADRDRMREGTKTDQMLGYPDRGWTNENPLVPAGSYEGCAFACHTPRGERFELRGTQWFQFKAFKTTLDWATENNVRLRIDVAKDAAKQVISDAIEINRKDSGSVRFSISTFHNQYYSLTKQGPLPLVATDDLDYVNRELSNLKIGYPYKTSVGVGSDYRFQPNTWPDSADGFQQFGVDLASWKASNEAKGRQQYVILVTDGVRSTAGGTPATGEVRPFDLEDCRKIKNVARLAVLYTKYLEPLPSDDTEMNKHLGSIYPQIEPNMKACASDPDLFAMADSSTEITQALKSLFGNIQSEVDAGNLRLTQ
jgi:Flp pilus assembly protein TadG